MAANRYPQVINGAPTDADAWYNAVAIDLSTLVANPNPLGRITSSTLTSSAATSGGTEVLAYSLTFTSALSRRYRVTYDASVQGTVGGAGEAMSIKYRWASGASVANTDTLVRIKAMNMTTTTTPLTFMGELVPGVIGQVTVGIFIVRTAGTGTYTLNGVAGANEGFFAIDDIGI